MGLRRALVTLAAVLGCALLFGVVLASGCSGAFAVGAENKRLEAEQKLAREWTTVRELVAADEARWADDPLFAASAGGDASQLIMAHIRWESSDAGAPVPAALSAMLKSGGDWPHNFSELDVSQIDTGWLTELGAFGFFDIEAAGSPVERTPWKPSYEPIPYFVDLQTLAKVHLTRGLQRGDARAAARDVREAARLCLTTEVFVGEMMGVALLGIERRAYEQAMLQGHDVSNWTPITDPERLTLRRVLFAARAPYVLLATGDLAAKTPRVGQCMALRDELGHAHEARGDSEPVVPERYAALTRALEAAPCRLRRPRAAWASNELDGQFSCERGYDPEHICFSPILTYVPFVDTAYGNLLVSISAPPMFERYRE